MSDLVRTLAEAFGQEPSPPAEDKLGGGITARAYWSFAPSLEVVVGEAERLPADGQALAAWRERLGRRPIPLVLLIEANGGSLVVGPSGDPPPVVSIDPRLVVSDLKAAAALDPHDVRTRLPRAWEQARGAGGLSGLRNVGLFSTHYLRARVPRLPGWAGLEQTGRSAVHARSLTARLEALGFEHEQRAEGIYVLRVHGKRSAAVLSYPAGQDLDRAASGGELPVAALLREMEDVGTEWGILACGDLWRLYSASHPGRTTSFVEVDLAKLAEPAYYAALFSAEALVQDGLAQAIVVGSREFAVGLGDRLRDRIYLEVVPGIVRALAEELERLEEPPETRDALGAVYDATLTLLYRLLFVLYAEAREFLPVRTSAGYREHSLRKRLDSVIATVEAEREFDQRATDIWSDLEETFGAIANGHTEWGVPPYDGGLFRNDRDSAVGRVLSRVRPSNAGLGPALYHLGYDESEEDAGRIDYSDLEIRHLGDIYEGLLQFEADRAREDLAYDAGSDAYVPADEGQPVAVPAGAVYLRSRSGGRKASGSYYTPQIVVRHLVEEALVPVHEDHLAEVGKLLDKRDQEAAARLLFAFRVCDPAMGSGHFLVDALDVLTDRVAAFLSERPVKPVRATLNQLREVVQTQARDLPSGVLAEIRDVELLKRVVLKRSIYGVDLNPMAVELAKLALWLDAFVPGLPLSFLDHNLKRGNSLVGVVGDEVIEALTPDQATIDDVWGIAESLQRATERAREAVERVELRLQDVEAAEEAERQRREALHEVEALYHRWTADSFGLPGTRGRIGERDTLEAANDEREAAKVAEEQRFFHWPLELPEVFGRDRPGFDVVLANPPWDKVRFEEQQFWVSRYPGLNALSADGRHEEMGGLRLRYPSDTDYEIDLRGRSEVLQRFFAAEYELQGSQHLDLAKLFLERSLSLTRDTGGTGLVLPRQFLVLVGWTKLREAVLRDARCSVLQLSNKGGWIFPKVEHRYMVALISRRRDRGDTAVIRFRGGVDRSERLSEAISDELVWTVGGLQNSVGDSLAMPLLPSERDAEVFAVMCSRPRLGERNDLFGGVLSDTPIQWTADPARSWIRPGAPDPTDYLILQTRHVGHFQLLVDTPPRKGVPKDSALQVLDRKWRRSRRLAGHLKPEPSSELDAVDLYRIVYRHVGRSDDSRTLIAALAPRGYLAAKSYVHSAIPMQNDVVSRLALLGLLNTAAADWWARRFVDRHVTAGVIETIPSPSWTAQEKLQVARWTAALACLPDEPMLSRLELSPSDLVTSDDQQVRLMAKIETSYAVGVGLGPGEVAWILSSFNEGGVPPVLRAGVMEELSSRS